MSKTILVTGGAGFIGSHFVSRTMKRYPDYKVIVLDALTYAGSINYLPVSGESNGPNGHFEFVYGNVRNSDLVSSLVERSDVVVHFAAETHVTRSIFDNLEFFETDVLGTHTVAKAVLKANHKVERFIHISTSEVYGTAETEVMDESHPLKPTTPYASAKCGADRLVYSYWATYGVPAVIVRPFNTYGPRQHLEKLIPRFVTSALSGEVFIIHGDGSAARDFVFVEDICRGIDMIMHAPSALVEGEVFNLSSGRSRSLNEIASDISRLMNYDRTKVRHIDDRPGQVVRHTGSHEKAKRLLGWAPQVDWEEGLRRTVDWFKANPDWWRAQLWMRTIPIRGEAGKVEFY